MNPTKVFLAAVTFCSAAVLLLGLTGATSAALIGHWALDETTGTIAADSAGSNDGVLQGGLDFSNDPNTTGSGSVPGVFGNALLGYSATDYVDVGNVLNPGTTDYSVTFWFKADTLPGTGFLVSKGNSVTADPSWAVYQRGGQNVEARNSLGSGMRKRIRSHPSGGISAGTWYHVALVLDHNPAVPEPNDPNNDWNITGYFDGNPFTEDILSEVQTGAMTTTDSIYFGRRFSGGGANPTRPMDGALDDIGIFNEALTQSQVQDIINNGVASFASPACDFDGGGCGLSDINLLMDQGDLTAGVPVGSGNQFDLNSDNTINEADITEWLGLAGTSRGYASGFLRGDTDDLDNDFDPNNVTRTVDITDFQNFLVGFTGIGSTWEVGNFDGNAIVDITDFSIHFLGGFAAASGGSYGPGQSIPEPSALLLLGLGGLLLFYLGWSRIGSV